MTNNIHLVPGAFNGDDIGHEVFPAPVEAASACRCRMTLMSFARIAIRLGGAATVKVMPVVLSHLH